MPAGNAPRYVVPAALLAQCRPTDIYWLVEHVETRCQIRPDKLRPETIGALYPGSFACGRSLGSTLAVVSIEL